MPGTCPEDHEARPSCCQAVALRGSDLQLHHRSSSRPPLHGQPARAKTVWARRVRSCHGRGGCLGQQARPGITAIKGFLTLSCASCALSASEFSKATGLKAAAWPEPSAQVKPSDLVTRLLLSLPCQCFWARTQALAPEGRSPPRSWEPSAPQAQSMRRRGVPRGGWAPGSADSAACLPGLKAPQCPGPARRLAPH